MPRSAAKSQAGKRGNRSSAQVTPPLVQEPEEEEIIPGLLTKTQWTELLIQEDSDDTVGEIMDELLSKVMEGCLEVYIQRQLAPFSAFWAKNYLTRVIEEHIMCLDEGEGPEEAAQTEDSEPMPTFFDTWAQGIVPVVKANTPQLHTASQDTDLEQVPVRVEPRINQQCKAYAQPSSPPAKEGSPSKSVTDERWRVFSPRPPPRIDRKKMQTNGKHLPSPPKPVQSKLLPALSCSGDARDIGVQSTARSRSFSSHKVGSSIAHKGRKLLPKLDPSSLPQHCIFPQYEIVDNNTRPIYKNPSGQSQLELRPSKLQNDCSVITLKQLTGSMSEPRTRKEADIWLKKLSFSTQSEGMFYSGPLKRDRIDLANGVSLLDTQAVEMNS